MSPLPPAGLRLKAVLLARYLSASMWSLRSCCRIETESPLASAGRWRPRAASGCTVHAVVGLRSSIPVAGQTHLDGRGPQFSLPSIYWLAFHADRPQEHSLMCIPIG